MTSNTIKLFALILSTIVGLLAIVALIFAPGSKAETKGQALHACVVVEGAENGISIGDEDDVWTTYWNGTYAADSPIAHCAAKLGLPQYNPGHVFIGYGDVRPHGTPTDSTYDDQQQQSDDHPTSV